MVVVASIMIRGMSRFSPPSLASFVIDQVVTFGRGTSRLQVLIKALRLLYCQRQCVRGLRLGGRATRKRKVAILGYRREKRSFFISNNLFRNRKSRTMASAKLADQKGPEQMRAETGKLRSLFNLPKTPKIDG